MKLLSLMTAVGLGLTLPVGAQTTTDEQKEQPVEKTKKETVEQPTRTEEHGKVSADTTKREGEVKTDVHASAREGGATTATSVFRNGRETNEHLSLHRATRETSDTHFSIGTHPREWWLQTYSIAIFDGCHYYLADNGCWYPAYGFDPSCDFSPGIVYCE